MMAVGERLKAGRAAQFALNRPKPLVCPTLWISRMIGKTLAAN